MPNYTFPASGQTAWHLTAEAIYGISPFALFDVDWTRGRGTCRWDRHIRGAVTNVVVNAARTGFTANFSITHAHREQRSAVLTGAMRVRVRDNEGGIYIKIAGLPDWRDNTTFEALRSGSALAVTPWGGQNFEVTLRTTQAVKLGASALFGNLYVKDLDRKVEVTYPLLGAGAGLAVGVTVYTSTSFRNVKLSTPRRYWDGASIEVTTAGVAVIIGSTHTDLYLTFPDRRGLRMKTEGWDHLGANLDVSVNWGTMQIGALGPRMSETAYE